MRNNVRAFNMVVKVWSSNFTRKFQCTPRQSTHPVGKFYGNKNVFYVFYVEWALKLTKLLIIHALFNAIHAYLKSD